MNLDFMRQALELAKSARNICPPNPAVGCVLVNKSVDGAIKIIGSGATQKAGQAHAEIMALNDARANNFDTHGATAYVTLEPCAHFGRTPPCCDALINAGISRVFAALKDPNPKVAGGGFEKMRHAGIDVQILDIEHEIAKEMRELNIGFFTKMTEKRPWIRSKTAISADGKTALLNGKSKWITGDSARADGQKLRAKSCCILTGVNTVIKDNPLLNVRINEDKNTRQPDLIILDSNLKTPLNSDLFNIENRKVYIYTLQTSGDKYNSLKDKGATLISFDTDSNQVNINEIYKTLCEFEYNEVHIEAGAGVNGSFYAAGLIDEWVIYSAPKILGRGVEMIDMANIPAIEDLSEVKEMKWHEASKIGDDLKMVLRKADI